MSTERSINLHGGVLGIRSVAFLRCVSAAMLVLFGGAALLVLSRRLAGALANPLEPGTLLAAGVLASAFAVAIRLGWSWLPPAQATPRLNRTVMILTSLAVVATAFGLCLPETAMAGRLFLCTFLVAEESWAWARYHKKRHKRGQTPFSPPFSPPRPLATATKTPDPFVAAFVAEEVMQQLTRSRTAEGADDLSGWLRTVFAAGQRTGNVHVAFCPPFSTLPEIGVEQIDGPEVRIKTAQLLPYGVRIELKLAATVEESTSVVLQFSARTPL